MCTGECKVKNFGLNHEDPRLFVTPQCGPNALYVVWSLVWLLYHLAMLGYDVWWTIDRDGVTEQRWLLYLTDWAYLLITLSCLVDFLTTVYVHCAAKHLLSRDSNHPMPCYLKFQWLLFTTSSVFAFCVTGAYYGTLAIMEIEDLEETEIHRKAYTFQGIVFSAGTSGFVLLNLFFSAKPVRYLHVYMPLVVCLLYGGFMLAYQKVQDTIVYEVYNWHDPFIAITITVAGLIVVVPIVHLLVFAIVKMRVWMSACCCGNKVAPVQHDGIAPKSYLDQVVNQRFSRNYRRPRNQIHPQVDDM